jgi:ArsR family transcriptional regulator
MTAQPSQSTADTLAALADPTRMRILELLSSQDRCVCHLVEDLELGQSIVSHHIGVLRRSGLVSSYPHARDRRWMYYRLDREALRALGAGLLNVASDDAYNPEPLPCPIDIEDSEA